MAEPTAMVYIDHKHLVLPLYYGRDIIDRAGDVR